MRGLHIDEVDHLDLDVLAIATDYGPGQVLATHRHRRAQFLYGNTGSMLVETAHGTWTVPPQRAVLIPPATDHSVRMDGVSTRSLYLEPRAVPWFPPRCTVVEVTPLLRELLGAAVAVVVPPPPGSRDAAVLELVLHELQGCSPLPLELPLPGEPHLRAACQEFLGAPRIDVTAQQWADRLGVGLRTLHRRVTGGTGLTLAGWRRRACVLHALPRLAAGHSVTAIATDLGYSSPAAFTTMFRSELGRPPSAYGRRSGPGRPGAPVPPTGPAG